MRTTSKTIAAKLPKCDLSTLPTADPGGNKPWIDPISHAIIVGALGTFGVSQAYVDAGLATKQDALGFAPVNKAGDTMTGTLSGTSFVASSALVGQNVLADYYLTTQANLSLRTSGAVKCQNVAGNADAALTAGAGTFSGIGTFADGRVYLGPPGAQVLLKGGTDTITLRGQADAFNAVLNAGTVNVSGLMPNSPGSTTIGTSSGLFGIIYQRADYLNYNAGMSGLTNYERGYQRWNNNVYEIGTERGGTGVIRDVTISPSGNLNLNGLGVQSLLLNGNEIRVLRHLVYSNHNTYDIGVVAAMPRDLNLARNANIGGIVSTGVIKSPSFFGSVILRDGLGSDQLGVSNNGVMPPSQPSGGFWLVGEGAGGTPYRFLGTSSGMGVASAVTGSQAIYFKTDGAEAVRFGGSGSSRATTLAGPLYLAPVTFATLPSATAQNGARYRITDRSQRECYSDGTDWRFAADDAIVT